MELYRSDSGKEGESFESSEVESYDSMAGWLDIRMKNAEFQCLKISLPTLVHMLTSSFCTNIK